MKKSKKATHKNRLVQWAVEYLIKERPVEGYPLTDFASLSYELRQGDVLLVEGRSRVCKIIKSLTQSSWSHAVLYIGHVHDIQDQALRKLIAHHVDLKNNPQLCVESVLGQGTIISPLTKYTNEHMRICRAKTIAPHDVQKVVSHALGAIGKPYNIRHVFDLMRSMSFETRVSDSTSIISFNSFKKLIDESSLISSKIGSCVSDLSVRTE